MTTPATLMTTYGRAPVAFVKGEGCYLIDSDGKRYLDAVAGVAVNALGHSHPHFIAAVQQQVATLTHTSNLYRIPLQEQLAAELCRRSGMEQVFFCNSGAEAIEASLKLARKIGHGRGLQVPAILVFEGAFHGRTLGALTATHSPKYQEGFTPLLDGFVRVPYDNLAAVAATLAARPDICAILVEPIQGEGGVRMPAPGYLKALRELCDRHDLLLILDEVQTGNGRTGTWFACQHEGVRPDILATAKGLGNGFPIGACLAAGPAAGVFQPGHHGSTFGGSPLACAAGLAVYAALTQEDLCGNAARLGAYLLERFRRELATTPGIRDIRGQGLMLGIELGQDCGELATRARERGVLINISSGTTIRLVPPLVLSQADAEFLAATVITLVQEFCHGH
ncbi:MAG: aspartate aminotransferase family protein [Pseudomonadales bacterium]|jgi:acetylornithine aminotransferase|nr:aspartate aminotransferase family protein [Pseudomonadales bacterium]